MEGKVNSKSLFDENFNGIFVATAEQAAADPVVEVNGMKIWIQPLRPEDYNLDHGMTLNEFLSLIDVLNDPSKQAAYNGFILQEGTEILTEQGIIRLDGNMPLSDALDLIGYDRNNLEQQYRGTAPCIQIIDTTTLLQLQDDTEILFHPNVREEIFYRYGITDFQRISFSEKLMDVVSIVKSRIQDTFRETLHESAYNIIKTKYSEDFGITQEEWLELVESKALDENGVFRQEFEKIVDLCLKEHIFLNLIELSGAQDQDANEIFSTLDTYLDENFGSLIEQLFAPLTFEAFISDVINQILNNIDNEGFVSFNMPTQEYFAEFFNQHLPQTALLSGGLLAPEMNVPITIEENYKNQLDNLALLLYKILKFDPNQRGFSITDQLLNLHSSEDSYQYTVKKLTDLLQKLGLTNDIFRNQKTFYNTILDAIYYVDAHPEISLDPQIREKITKIANSITKSFDENIPNRFSSKEVEILEKLDPLLNDLFGYVGYSLLQLGLIRFDNDGNTKFELPTSLKELKDHLKLFNIKSIAHTGLDYYKEGDITNAELVEILTSILLSGHFKSIAVIDENGKIQRDDWRYVYTHPMASFLSETFKDFRKSEKDASYHSSIWLQISKIFLNGRFEILDKYHNLIFFSSNIPSLIDINPLFFDLQAFDNLNDRIKYQEKILGIVDLKNFPDTEIILDSGGFNPNSYSIYLGFGEHNYYYDAQGNLKEYGNGLLHIISHHYVEFVEFGKWVGKDLSTLPQIVKFLFEIITTQVGIAIDNRGTVVYAFRNIFGEIRFLEIAIDSDVDYDGDYIGRIHTAYPVGPNPILKFQQHYEDMIFLFTQKGDNFGTILYNIYIKNI